MKAPDGIPNSDNQVCTLKKSIYGLKDASPQWFAKLTHALVLHGFTQSKNDYSMFVQHKGTDIIILRIYVDDILIAGNNISLINSIKDILAHTFSIKNLGLDAYFLGFELAYLPDGISLTQHIFTNELLHDSGLDTFKLVTTPLPLPQTKQNGRYSLT